MRALAALCLASTPALADVAGPDAVFDGGWDCRPHALGIPGWLDCLAAAGASEAARAFAARLAAPEGYDLPGILIHFEEHGAVDLGTVVFPDLANSNEQTLFLNGDPPILHPGEVLGETRPTDAASRAIAARHPDAFPRGPLAVGPHRRLPDGTQRFVVTDDLVDGCRACEIVGTMVAEIDFRDGRVAGTRVLGWTADSPEAEPLRDRLLAGDAVALQLALNLAGYGAGAMDGRIGPATRAAHAAFRADHCAPEAEADALIAAAAGAPAPCAP